jgi:hypothetical protein
MAKYYFLGTNIHFDEDATYIYLNNSSTELLKINKSSGVITTVQAIAGDFSGQVNASLIQAENVTLLSVLGGLTVSNQTTTQRNALSANTGMIIYNTTDGKFQGYNGATWDNLS